MFLAFGFQPSFLAAAASEFDLRVRRLFDEFRVVPGFSTKSRTPLCIASTASSTDPQAVNTTTGNVLSRARMRDKFQALLTGSGVTRVVQIHQDQIEFFCLIASRTAAGEFTLQCGNLLP